jgi:hypothetical protein
VDEKCECNEHRRGFPKFDPTAIKIASTTHVTRSLRLPSERSERQRSYGYPSFWRLS